MVNFCCLLCIISKLCMGWLEYFYADFWMTICMKNTGYCHLKLSSVQGSSSPKQSLCYKKLKSCVQWSVYNDQGLLLNITVIHWLISDQWKQKYSDRYTHSQTNNRFLRQMKFENLNKIIILLSKINYKVGISLELHVYRIDYAGLGHDSRNMPNRHHFYH